MDRRTFIRAYKRSNEERRQHSCNRCPGMVKAAYSSGKPALGVGAGNTPVIIDDTADVKMAVNSIIHSKTFDNGMICASEQSVTVLEKVYKEVKDEFALRGC